MVSPRDTYCPMKGIHHASLQTRGCPHCLLDLQPELGKLPSTFNNVPSTHIKKERTDLSVTPVKGEVEAIDLTESPQSKSKHMYLSTQVY